MDPDYIWKPPQEVPVFGVHTSRYRKYTIPRSRSRRNLAILRRVVVLKPRFTELRRCVVCGCWRRLGRLWAPKDEKQDAWYCEPCWYNWSVSTKQWFVKSCKTTWDRPFAEQGVFCHLNGLEGSANGVEGNIAPSHFEFIEIGTSNYDTFTQAVAEHPDAKPYAWRFLPWHKHPLQLRGIAVDLNQSYLDQLPDLPCVSKVCAAVSEFDTVHVMHHVPLQDVQHWESIFAVRGSFKGHRAMRLARGCSALARHRVLQNLLGKIGLRHLIRARTISTVGIDTLFRRFSVKSVGVLALDCEGYDCAILRGLLRACDKKPEWTPEWIWFESNGMNDELFGAGTEAATILELEKRGYRVWWGGGYHASGKRDTCVGLMTPPAYDD